MYDLVIVGGGISGGLTLIHLLEELRASRVGSGWNPAAFRVAWLDGTADFGRGPAYGQAAHPKFLLNNDVSCMNLGDFHTWVHRNHTRWMAKLEQDVDPAVQNWLRRHRDRLNAATGRPDHYLPMFLPRCVFGMFLADWLADSLYTARRLGITIDLIPEEATMARRQNGMLHIGIRQSRSLETGWLILALGSLPPDPDPDLQGTDGYLHESRMPDGGASLRQMVQGASRAKDGPCSAIILGSNAAAIESLYTIALDSTLSELLKDICVISRSGRLPCAASIFHHFRPEHLSQLLTLSRVSAESLISAASADAAQAERDGFNAADCGAAIIETFRKVFPLLSPEQKQNFVEHYGACFTALNRHTPPDYADASATLQQQGKLRNLAGEVLQVARARDRFEVRLRHSQAVQTETLVADVVINCCGAGLLSRANNPFLRNILDSREGIARINRSGQGISVSANFEASPGVFVVGPLLAGHSKEPFHLWNLERAERIDDLAKHAAGILAQRILISREPIAAAC